jgi:hypothetical protein
MRVIPFLGFLFGAVTAAPVGASMLPPLEALMVANAQRERGESAAKAGDCYVIADGESRAYCLAKAHKDASRCNAIQRSDLRAMCRAEVRR